MKKTVMPIMAFYGPHPHHWMETDLKGKEDPCAETINDECFKTIAECGINELFYCSTDYTKHPDKVITNLKLADKYGMGYFVTDTAIVEYSKSAEADLDTIKKRLKEYNQYPAFRGMFIVDEPRTEVYDVGAQPYISDFVNTVKAFKSLGVPYRAGLLPIYGQYDWEGRPQEYRDYVKEYCDVFQPAILEYDHYPFVDNREPRMDIYFWNLSVIREYAKENGIPFGVTIQAGGQWNDHKAHFDSIPYYPNEGQFMWNVNTCLAMGAKSVMYFPLIQPWHFSWAKTKEYDFERNGLIGADGRKNQWYYYAQKINKQIVAIDEVLMSAENEGVIVSSEQAKKDLSPTNCVIASGTFEELSSLDGEALVGCFKYEGKTAFYVVNYSMQDTQEIKLTFKQSQHIIMIRNAEVSNIDTESLTLDMTAGEGILLVVK